MPQSEPHMKKSVKLLPILLLLSIFQLAPPARAAFDIFLQIPGYDGESTKQGHVNWIEVYSFSHGMDKPTNGAPHHLEVSYVKNLDKSSPLVNLKLNQGGQAIPTVTFDFEKVGGETPVVFYK